MTNIVITGASGRMGRALIEATLETDGAILSGATVRPSSTLVGADAGELIGQGHRSAPIHSGLDLFDSLSPVVIDFTAIEATLEHLQWCRENDAPCVIGTTGFSEAQETVIAEAAKAIPVVYAPNFSVGVNVVFDLLDRASRVFGDSVDIEVLEAHHRHKVDAPSGTALAMGRVVANALARDLSQVAVFGREGQTALVYVSKLDFSTGESW